MKTLATLDRPTWLPPSAWPWDTCALGRDGARIAVTDTGRGPTLLFVHVGSWSFVWRDVLLRLQNDFRCVTVDAPGCGLSDPVPAPTLAHAGDAVTAVIDALQLRDVTLVAHDLGGPAGFLAAARRADRAVFRAGIGVPARRAWHAYFRDARGEQTLYAEVDAALRGSLANRPLLTIFGQFNDPLRFQPRWKALFPNASQLKVRRGNHFPMCDDPDLVASELKSFVQQL